MGHDNATSLVPKTANTNQKQDRPALSAEDIAWADSCLIENPEISETNLDSLKAALLDILAHHPESLGSFTSETGSPNTDTDTEEETSHTPGNESPTVPLSPTKPFLATYNNEMIHVPYSDLDDDFGFSGLAVDVDPPSGDIFMVWDLDTPAEEDELGKQLEEALSVKGLKIESVDHLVDRVADLSFE